MSRVEVFLDETPGETRGIVVRDGGYERLIVQRDDDRPTLRLSARVNGRVMRIEPAMKAAFVDLGVADMAGFLSLPSGQRLTEGARVEVEVAAEPRDGKGPTLRWIGPATGEVGLTTAGPDVRAWLEVLVPGVEPVTGAQAIQAGWNAEEEALSSGVAVADLGLDLDLRRTRALVAADLDWSAVGAGARRTARDRANGRGLDEVARLVRLKSWGGLVAIDLIGVGHDGAATAAAARRAFRDEPQLVLGPVNRFGVLMLSVPWRWTPVEQRLATDDPASSMRRSAQEGVRRLYHALLSDRSTPRRVLRCSPEEAALAEPWVTRIGPRAGLVADAGCRPGEAALEAG